MPCPIADIDVYLAQGGREVGDSKVCEEHPDDENRDERLRAKTATLTAM